MDYQKLMQQVVINNRKKVHHIVCRRTKRDKAEYLELIAKEYADAANDNDQKAAMEKGLHWP